MAGPGKWRFNQFDGYELVVKAVEEWEPEEFDSEGGYQNSLYAYLHFLSIHF